MQSIFSCQKPEQFPNTVTPYCNTLYARAWVTSLRTERGISDFVLYSRQQVLLNFLQRDVSWAFQVKPQSNKIPKYFTDSTYTKGTHLQDTQFELCKRKGKSRHTYLRGLWKQISLVLFTLTSRRFRWNQSMTTVAAHCSERAASSKLICRVTITVSSAYW